MFAVLPIHQFQGGWLGWSIFIQFSMKIFFNGRKYIMMVHEAIFYDRAQLLLK